MMKLTLRSVQTRHCVTVFGDEGMSYLNKILKEQVRQGFQTFLLADEHTSLRCLPSLLSLLPDFRPDGILTTAPGEDSKTLEMAARLWRELADAGADRHSLLLNLGGGVVTDLGGFVASCFKRGIRFINIPTTLIGMTDAASGGKTAVNLDGLKNQTGTFTLPEAIVIHPVFLNTLDPSHLKQGLAEVAKCALIADERCWKWLRSMDPEEIPALPPGDPAWMKMIQTATVIKNKIVQIDFEERKERMLLNFGHTVGHAFESLMLKKDTPVSHGEAVAMGMICETWLSWQLFGLTEEQRDEITGWLYRGFGRKEFSEQDRETLAVLMMHDKKNVAGRIRFTGISRPGAGVIRGEITPALLAGALDFYQKME